MLRSIRTLLICTVYGALGTAMVRFLYSGYMLIADGVRRDDVALATLLLDHVQVREFAILGAAGGLAFGLLIVLSRLLGWAIWRIRRPKVEAAEEHDTNAILQADRQNRAESYLANRRA